MQTNKTLPLLIALIIITSSAAATPKVEQSLDISPVWSGHPVGFCLLTQNDYQYVAYYDQDRRMTVASRKLDSNKWKYQILDSNIKWDSHNYIRMALDNQGYIHLAGNMHCIPLIYFRTQKPNDITTFQRIPQMTGQKENRCTYPVFINGAQNQLIFRYRDGGSGNGNEIYNLYNEKTKTWTRLLDKPLTDGQGKMNAYPRGPLRGPEGTFHLTWIWRDTPDCSTNHDLSYAKSKDLVNWKTASGDPLTLPITIDTPGVIIDPVPPRGGIINGNGSIGFDKKNRPVIAYHKFDKNGNTQAYAARFENSKWKITQISDWNWRWYFSGGGSINTEVSLGTVTPESDGTLSLSWRNKNHGSGIWRLDETTLKPIGSIKKKSDRPGHLGKVESDFPGMQTRWANDLGSSNEPNVKYFLRWETLGRNRDRPRQGPLPAPSMLRLYKIKNEPE